MKVTRKFAGWYNVTIDNELAFTIVQSENGSWNLFKEDDTLKGLIESANTLKEIKEIVKQIIEEGF